jgi:hypothetical protein
MDVCAWTKKGRDAMTTANKGVKRFFDAMLVIISDSRYMIYDL